MLHRPYLSFLASALLVASASGFVIAAVFARRADNGMNDAFSLFWQKHQKDLRAALKQTVREPSSIASQIGASPPGHVHIERRHRVIQLLPGAGPATAARSPWSDGGLYLPDNPHAS